MPKRIATYRVDSAEVQGEGSWVELSYLTYDEMTASSKSDTASQLLSEHVIAWNWVDSDGEPFGEPEENLGKLFLVERQFLLERIFNPKSEEEEKN